MQRAFGRQFRLRHLFVVASAAYFISWAMPISSNLLATGGQAGAGHAGAAGANDAADSLKKAATWKWPDLPLIEQHLIKIGRAHV